MVRRIAVIGSGISGLSAAWLLSRGNAVTVFEKASRLGGHVNTVNAQTPEGSVAVDTGFIVYNERNYPNLTALFTHLGVKTAVSDMSFSVSLDQGAMEYSGQHLNGLFGQRSNIIRIEHWRLVSDILRFFREAERGLDSVSDDISIGKYLADNGYSRAFIEDHILPVSAAIWSTPARAMLEFPARTFISFFANHGLLKVANRPDWRTVTGGARSYVDKLLADRSFSTVLDAGIRAITRDAEGADLHFADGRIERFDQLVMACAPGAALSLLSDVDAEEQAILGAFGRTVNRAVLHTDRRFMPRRKRLWTSWNYLRSGPAQEPNLSLTYWMNLLQPLATRTDLFVTLNADRDFADGTVIAEIDYEHPLFDSASVAAQRQVGRLQGRRRTWFAGAWLGYGFHEDGLQSGLEVAERLGPAMRPWSRPEQRARIAHCWPEEGPMWAAE